jgi:hypothetical protein
MGLLLSNEMPRVHFLGLFTGGLIELGFFLSKWDLASGKDLSLNANEYQTL